jgi:hypothetical protein
MLAIREAVLTGTANPNSIAPDREIDLAACGPDCRQAEVARPEDLLRHGQGLTAAGLFEEEGDHEFVGPGGTGREDHRHRQGVAPRDARGQACLGTGDRVLVERGHPGDELELQTGQRDRGPAGIVDGDLVDPLRLGQEFPAQAGGRLGQQGAIPVRKEPAAAGHESQGRDEGGQQERG